LLFFFISLIVAFAVHRAWLYRTATYMAILFGSIAGVSAYGSLDPRTLAHPDQSGVYLYVSMSVALSVAEVVAAFLLVWGIRRFISSRKKANK
jgi:hypothetical protein